MLIHDLDTPAVVCDLDKLERNIRDYAAHARAWASLYAATPSRTRFPKSRTCRWPPAMWAFAVRRWVKPR